MIVSAEKLVVVRICTLGTDFRAIASAAVHGLEAFLAPVPGDQPATQLLPVVCVVLEVSQEPAPVGRMNAVAFATTRPSGLPVRVAAAAWAELTAAASSSLSSVASVVVVAARSSIAATDVAVVVVVAAASSASVVVALTFVVLVVRGRGLAAVPAVVAAALPEERRRGRGLRPRVARASLAARGGGGGGRLRFRRVVASGRCDAAREFFDVGACQKMIFARLLQRR